MVNFLAKKKIQRHQYLFKEGDVVDYIYIVRKGEIKVTKRFDSIEENVDDIATREKISNSLQMLHQMSFAGANTSPKRSLLFDHTSPKKNMYMQFKKKVD